MKRLEQKEEKTVVLSVRTTKHTRKMLKSLRRKRKLGTGEAIRQAIETSYLMEFSPQRSTGHVHEFQHGGGPCMSCGKGQDL